MVSFEHFQLLFEKELAKIPFEYKRGINGFYVDQRVIRQSSQLKGLYILGHYHSNKNFHGPAVTLYYGSFRKVFRQAGTKTLRREIAKTLAHEILHHWEIQSGINDLGEEDERRLAQWRAQMGIDEAARARRDLFHALIFLFLVFSAIALAGLFIQSL